MFVKGRNPIKTTVMYLNNLQSYIFGSILLFMVCFVACEKSSIDSSVSYGTNVQLKTNDKVIFENLNTDKLKLTVTEILDNFCPDNAQCITAGYAEVKLAISDSENQNINFSLFYGAYLGNLRKPAFQPDTMDFSLNSKLYRAILQNVKKDSGSKELKAEITLIKK